MGIFLKCLDTMGGADQLTLEDVLAVNGPGLDWEPDEITVDESYLPLKEAIKSGESLEIEYQDARGNITIREITPLSIGLMRNTPVLEAFCHYRQDKRNFRLDRIIEMKS